MTFKARSKPCQVLLESTTTNNSKHQPLFQVHEIDSEFSRRRKTRRQTKNNEKRAEATADALPAANAEENKEKAPTKTEKKAEVTDARDLPAAATAALAEPDACCFDVVSLLLRRIAVVSLFVR